MRAKFNRLQPSIVEKRQAGVVGDASGNVAVPGLPGYIWVRVGSTQAIPVVNNRVNAAAGMPVYVGYDPIAPNLFQVLGSASNSADAIQSIAGGSGSIGPHARTHDYLGSDPVFIDKRQDLDARIGPAVPGTYSTGAAVLEVWPAVFLLAGAIVTIDHQLVVLDTHIPSTAGHSRYVGVSATSGGSIALTDGSDIASLTPALTDIPTLPTGNVPLGFVRLYHGMTSLSDRTTTDIIDVRTQLATGSGGGGGTGDVVGPSSATNGHVALFDGTTGKLIKDGGVPATGDVVGPAGATNNHLAVFDGATGKLVKDGGAAPTGTVLDTGATTANHLAIWNGASDHTIKDGGAIPSAGAPLGTATPMADGTAAAGSATNASHEDHIHPVGNAVYGPSTSPTDGHLVVFDGTTGKLVKDGDAVPSGGAGMDYINVQDQKSTSTNGGTSSAGGWQTRDLNTEQSDSGGHVSISSNQMTLDAGTYIVNISAPCCNVNSHQIRLYNITDSSVVLTGTSELAYAGSNVQTRSLISGSFTISGSKVLAVQYKCSTGVSTIGLGVAGSFGTEVYTIVEMWKE